MNPWGLTWDEVRASDIMRIDLEGNVLEGKWTVTPAIPLHLELHKARHDVGVVVHNHSRWGTVWADLHRVPPVYDQTSAMVPGAPALYDDFGGSVDAVENARACVEALGDARMALLANHGVLVVGADIAQAHHRCVVLEWRCRQRGTSRRWVRACPCETRCSLGSPPHSTTCRSRACSRRWLVESCAPTPRSLTDLFVD